MLSLNKKIILLMLFIFIVYTALAFTVVFSEDAIKVFDLRILVKIQYIFAFVPVQIPIFISDFGYDLYMAPQLVIIGVIMLKLRQWKDFILYFLLTEGVYLFVMIIKEIIQRIRPDEIYQKVHKTSFSFPSGHSSVNMFFYLTLAFLLSGCIKQRGLRILVYILCIIWILLVGLSRVFLGVHYPSDVFGGYLVGIFVFLLFVLLSNMLKNKNENRLS